ncbi:MAG: hypothetical protein ACK2UO_19710 [Caldilineaceae bacterium]
MSSASITTRPHASVSQDTPIVRRVDHLVIRVAESAYRQLFSMFAGALQLPSHRRATQRSAYTGGSVYAGNVDFRLLPAPAGVFDTAAQFYGLVLETQSQDLSRLSARGIPYIPAPYLMPQPGQEPALLRVNVFLGGYLGATPSMRALFALNKLVPDSVWMRTLAREAPDRIQGAKFMVNHVYRDGMVFLVKYNPGWRATDAERRRSIADFIARRGGSLGLISVKEVVIGTTNLMSAYARWHKLLYPAEETDQGCWQLGDGPAIRLIAAEQDAIHHLVWEVESLAEAYQVLGDMGLLGRVLDEEIRIKRDMMGGLDIRLVEVGITA